MHDKLDDGQKEHLKIEDSKKKRKEKKSVITIMLMKKNS